MRYFILLATGFLFSLGLAGCATRCSSVRQADDASPKPSILSKPVQLERLRPFAVCGSLTTVDPDRCISLFNFGGQMDSLLRYLTACGINIEIDEDGNAVVFDSTELRRALSKYHAILARRCDIITQNIANVNSVEDKDASPWMPYRRRVLVVGDDGSVTVELDPSLFRLEWSPNDPLAIKEGPDAGFIRRSNVDLVKEEIDLIVTTGETLVVQEMIRELYRGSCSDLSR